MYGAAGAGVHVAVPEQSAATGTAVHETAVPVQDTSVRMHSPFGTCGQLDI
jgi:hypothetical protein